MNCPKCKSEDLTVINEVHSKGAKFWKLCLCGFLGLCGTGKTTNEQRGQSFDDINRELISG